MEQKELTCLHEDITIVPVGGLPNIATFVALLGANQLELAVLHDYSSQPDQRLESVIREKIIRERYILNYGMFRGVDEGSNSVALQSDVEDLISPQLYLRLFNATFKKELAGVEISQEDLPQRDRIVERLNLYIKQQQLVLRASGGFNHYW